MNTLVDSAWLEAHLGDPGLRPVEVDVSPAAYREGHLPGAVLWDIYADLKDADYHTVGPAAVRRLVERSGIDRDSLLVFYGYAPAMGYWLARLYRHPEARILNTSRAVWQREGRPWTTEVVEPPPTDYPLPPEDGRLRALLPEVERSAAGTLVLDVRTGAEYRGERFWPGGAEQPDGRAGHVPAARHLPAAELFDPDGAFRSPAELRRLHAPLGLDGDREVISYCTIGARAAASWYALTELLGHRRARVYDGSWAEYGRTPGVPVEA